MKFKMAHNSLFAILLRSPWWISIGIATFLALVAGAMLPRDQVMFSVAAGFPFLVIGCIAAWRQFRAPSAAKAADMLEQIASMSWVDFSKEVARVYAIRGFEVRPYPGKGADFEATKSGTRIVIGCKRWKAASTGVETLRELQSAAESRGARAVYMTIGQVSENARAYAAKERIEVIDGLMLSHLLLARK